MGKARRSERASLTELGTLHFPDLGIIRPDVNKRERRNTRTLGVYLGKMWHFGDSGATKLEGKTPLHRSLLFGLHPEKLYSEAKNAPFPKPAVRWRSWSRWVHCSFDLV